MGAIVISGLRKAFGETEVIRGIDITVANGEFVALVGPSGCGKSTLLRMIAGLDDITAGEIRIGGKVVNDLAPKDRDVAMVFQSYALYPLKTVFDNMGFGLRMRRRPRDEIERRVGSAASSLELASYLSRLPKELSGGQRQRVAMGRAIVRAPEAFLFDEPLSNLDARLRTAMRTEIKARHQTLKTTTIYVTHDQIEATTMADRIVVMNAGNVEQVGTPADLYDRPVNTVVAGFIGSPTMNILAGCVKRHQGATWVELACGVRLPIGDSVDTQVDQRVLYGVRPEDVEIVPRDGTPASVLLVEPTGADQQVHVRFGNHSLCLIVDRRNVIGPGDQIQFRARHGSVHLFDLGSGRRI
ncbi:MAG: sn-glycerol-3-phosphate ABC transporter ATP-binding protein UgpC [Casimicrobiaceae bacterium]